MHDTNRYLSPGAVALSAALLLLLSACGEPAEEQQGSVAPPATEQAPADLATEEPAEGATTQQ
ncbi:MAG: hypothetical protein K0S35_3897 [Geminicoccaceae bacterium]|nr:hypothetical protein [Geminicoccaceae bacterium]